MVTTPPDASTRLIDDASLERFLAPLLERAIRRQSWFLFLDEDSRMVGPIMPCADHPPSPDYLQHVPDLGDVTWAEVVAARFSEIMREFGFAQLVIVWERLGSDSITGEDRSWARAFGEEFRAQGAHVRAQFILHDRGLRILAPDDLLPDSTTANA